jgi:DNA polymerase-3 subunit epsilon
MKILIVDTETTGLGPFASPPQNDAIIEVGAVLWDSQESAVIAHWSDLIAHPTNAAENVNHISLSLMQQGRSAASAFSHLRELAARSYLIAAHNAQFDKTFLDLSDCDLGRPWVCTKNDVVWPGVQAGSSLVYTAVGLGVPVTGAHRALTDCLMLARCFERVSELFAAERAPSVEKMIELARVPKKLYEVADRSYDAARNALAKAEGFAFHGETKTWRKRMLPEAIVKLPFAVKEVLT